MQLSKFKCDDEFGRVYALNRYDLLSSDFDEEFSDILSLVENFFPNYHVAITFVDRDRQWVKAALGLSLKSCGRDESFCTHTIQHEEVLAVSSASADMRFRHSPFVTGEARIQSYLGAPLMTPDGYNIGAICVFGKETRVFTESEKNIIVKFSKIISSQIELRQIASQDSLTGAMTRRNFDHHLKKFCSTNEPASLIVIDIDHFKYINDTFGHPIGDLVLQETVKIIRKCVRKVDFIGRLGGEEFGILLPYRNWQFSVAVAERLRKAVNNKIFSAIENRRISISLGIAEKNLNESPANWVKRADLSLYEAKHSGRNRFVLSKL